MIFVRLPSSREIWDIESRRYPRADYWDAMASRVDARFIHFADHPELAGFELPDGVHIDDDDQVTFTRVLAGIVFGAALTE